MSIFSRLLGRGGKKRSEDWRHAAKAIEDIGLALGHLQAKANSLNDSFDAQKQAVSRLVAQAAQFAPQNEIAAAKCEQSILGAITATSSACDAVLSGAASGDEFTRQLSALETLVTQRAHFSAPSR